MITKLSFRPPVQEDEKLKGSQWKAMKMSRGLAHTTHDDRMMELGLFSLEKKSN